MGVEVGGFGEPDLKWADKVLLELLRIPGTTGREKPVADYVRRALVGMGISSRRIVDDGAARRIALPTSCGNLVVRLPGSGMLKNAGTRLFVAHMDTVELALGARPVVKGGTLFSSTGTALGGDDRAGVAVLLSMLRTVTRRGVSHPPLTGLFTVREESGLWGARMVDLARLGRPVMGFSYDGSSPFEVLVKAPGSDRMDITVHGVAAHAGGSPEEGVSAAVVASLAVAELQRGKMHGLIADGSGRATSNIGSMNGGIFHNIVCPEVKIVAEARSYRESVLNKVVASYKNAFRRAAAGVKSAGGTSASIDFNTERLYYPFSIPKSSQVVRLAMAAMKMLGYEGIPVACKGGLDANWLVRHGIPTVTLGAGINGAHSIDESVDVDQFRTGCRIASMIAQLSGW